MGGGSERLIVILFLIERLLEKPLNSIYGEFIVGSIPNHLRYVSIFIEHKIYFTIVIFIILLFLLLIIIFFIILIIIFITMIIIISKCRFSKIRAAHNFMSQSS